MARNEKRPHELTLELLNKVGKTVTPSEIDKHVNVGAYSSKHVWFLRKLGFGIDATKDGRTVVSYTLVSEPANAAEIRAGKPKKAPKVKAPKVAKAPKAKAVKAPKVAKTAKAAPAKKTAPVKVKSKNLAKMKEVLEKKKSVEAELKSTPPAATYSVDPEWDSTEALDVRDLL